MGKWNILISAIVIFAASVYLLYVVVDMGIKRTTVITENVLKPVPAMLSADVARLRVKHLDEMCHKFQPSRSWPAIVNRRLLVDNRHRVIVCAVAKAGSTSWKTMLIASSGANITAGELAEKSDQYVHNYNTLRGYGLQYLTSYTNSTDILHHYFKLLTVRHPFTRLYSAYKDKFVERLKAVDAMERMFSAEVGEHYPGLYPTFPNITFAQFLTLQTKTKLSRFAQDEHWAPIVNLCHPCQVGYDYVARQETFDDDMQRLLPHFNVTEFTSSRRHVTHHASQSNTNSQLLVTMRQLPQDVYNLLLEKYEMDLQLFGYTWDMSKGTGCQISNSKYC